MKRLVTVVTPAILLVVSVLFGLSDTDISIADTSVPDNEVISSISKASNSSASATITTTMYAVADEYISISLAVLNFQSFLLH